MSLKTDEYEWNPLRKLWHFAGCLLMVALFYLWKDIRRPVSGIAVMVLVAWAETAVALIIDILRFYSPRANQAAANLPFYGKLMRPVERDHFNATTYYLLAAAILITLHWLGWCREITIIAAVMVLGAADPAAAWTRHALAKRGVRSAHLFGIASFVAASFVMLYGVGWFLNARFASGHLLFVGFAVAIVESYTKYWVLLIHPITRRIQRMVAHKTTVWLFRFYPDDNLLIPLAVAFLMGILPWFM